MKNDKPWFVDGTFTVAPKGYQQIPYIIVPSRYNDQDLYLPACHILLTHKTQDLYEQTLILA